ARGVSPRTAASASITLTLQSPTIVGGNGTTASIVLATPAPAGGVVVTMTNPPGTIVQAGASQVGTIQAIGSTKIAVAAGQRQVVVNVVTAGVAITTVATLSVTLANDVATAT